MDFQSTSLASKQTVHSILGNIKSGIGLDISKNHTGIVYWDGSEIHEYGFSTSEYDKTDYFAEYKMRRDFKNKLKEIVQGKYFEICIVEDVYGGENFDTVRKLLALNTVIDELIFENVCTVKKFLRWNEPKWAKCTRTIYKQRGKLKSKVETQGILEYLGYPFYMAHKDDRAGVKKEIFFEDICDACGMLLGAVMDEIMNINIVKGTPLKLSNIKMVYVEDLADTYSCRDKRISEEGFIDVELDFRKLEDSIIKQASAHPNDVLCAFLPSDKLGVFGMKHKFTFYDSEESYLLFYKK